MPQASNELYPKRRCLQKLRCHDRFSDFSIMHAEVPEAFDLRNKTSRGWDLGWAQ